MLLFARLDRQRFRRVVFGALFLSGLVLVIRGEGGFGGGAFGGGGFGGRGGFDPNMTPEERRKRMEERMASMTPEERAAFHHAVGDAIECLIGPFPGRRRARLLDIRPRDGPRLEQFLGTRQRRRWRVRRA